jgi:photosystem II stability/assembly factor-like uncharacterized protein
MNGPWSGSIGSFAAGNDVILAGSVDIGLFRSTNGGTSWTPLDTGVLDQKVDIRKVTTLAVHNDIFFAGFYGEGLMRSKDNGSTWTAANTGITYNTDVTYRRVQTLCASDSSIFAGVENKVFRSMDEGEHWTLSGRFGNDGLVMSIAALGNSLFLGARGRTADDIAPNSCLWVSKNNGETWAPVDSVLPFNSINALVTVNGAVFASTKSGIFCSNDSGESWTPANSGIKGKPGPPYFLPYYMLFKTDTSIFTATDSAIYRFTNLGSSWTAINSEISQFTVQAFAASGDTLFAGTLNSGIFRSTDNGSNWIPVNSGIRSTIVIGTLSNNGDTLLAGTGELRGYGDILSTANCGLQWSNRFPNFTIPPKSYNVLFDILQGGAVVSRAAYLDTGFSFYYSLSGNGGSSWIDIDSFPGGDLYSFTSTPNHLFIGTEKGVVYSTDSGKTWNCPESNIGEQPAYSLLWKDSRIIAGTNGGVLISADSGRNWKKYSFGLMSMRVEALVLCNNMLFAGSSYNGVFRSDDNGATWNTVNSGLTNQTVFSLISHDSKLFAGTYGNGVFMSTNNGESWKPFNQQLEDKRIYSLLVMNDQLFAGTEGYGIWQRPLAETGIISDRLHQRTVPEKEDLHLLVHEKSGSIVTISFSNPLSNHIGITIYNLSGKAVASILNQHAGLGTHELLWDTRNLVRGCYIIKMQSGGKSAARIIRISH